MSEPNAKRVKLSAASASSSARKGEAKLVFKRNDRPFHPARLSAVLRAFPNHDAKTTTTRAAGGKRKSLSPKSVVSAKGQLWVATANAYPCNIRAGKSGQLELVPNEIPYLSAIGSDEWDEDDWALYKELKAANKWGPHGDRTSEAVFTPSGGVKGLQGAAPFDKHKILNSLNGALLTDEELEAGPELWKTLEDCFFDGEYFEVGVDEEEGEEEENSDSNSDAEGEGESGEQKIAVPSFDKDRARIFYGVQGCPVLEEKVCGVEAYASCFAPLPGPSDSEDRSAKEAVTSSASLPCAAPTLPQLKAMMCLLSACQSKSSGQSAFWIGLNDTPQHPLEQLAVEIFQQHFTKNVAEAHQQRAIEGFHEGGDPRQEPNGVLNQMLGQGKESDVKTCIINPELCGAQFWAVVGEPESSEGEGPKEDVSTSTIPFHFENDKFIEEHARVGVCPVLGTVTYLGSAGAPTVVTSCKADGWVDRVHGPDGGKNECAQIVVSHPAEGKHITFDGHLLHGESNAMKLNRLELCGKDRTRASSQAKDQRITFHVSIWVNSRPHLAKRLHADELLMKAEKLWGVSKTGGSSAAASAERVAVVDILQKYKMHQSIQLKRLALRGIALRYLTWSDRVQKAPAKREAVRMFDSIDLEVNLLDQSDVRSILEVGGNELKGVEDDTNRNRSTAGASQPQAKGLMPNFPQDVKQALKEQLNGLPKLMCFDQEKASVFVSSAAAAGARRDIELSDHGKWSISVKGFPVGEKVQVGETLRFGGGQSVLVGKNVVCRKNGGAQAGPDPLVESFLTLGSPWLTHKFDGRDRCHSVEKL